MELPDFQPLEERINFFFEDKDLLAEALTHRSYLNEVPSWPLSHNERLEFLGDAVLELAITERLFKQFPKEDEGKLTVFRAALVNYQTLAQVAKDINLEEFILLSRGEKKDTSRAKEVILANGLEALIGAIYEDQGFSPAAEFTEKFIWPKLTEILKTKSYRDAKSELQEMVQEKFRLTPTYRVLYEEGPAHDRTFTIGVYFGDKLIAQGTGMSKQDAELAAAKEALKNASSS